MVQQWPIKYYYWQLQLRHGKLNINFSSRATEWQVKIKTWEPEKIIDVYMDIYTFDEIWCFLR